MDDISEAPGPMELKKGIRKYARTEVEKNERQVKQNKVYSIKKQAKEKEKIFQKW